MYYRSIVLLFRSSKITEIYQNQKLIFHCYFLDEEEDYEEMLQKGLLEKNENDVRNRSRANYYSDSGK